MTNQGLSLALFDNTAAHCPRHATPFLVMSVRYSDASGGPEHCGYAGAGTALGHVLRDRPGKLPGTGRPPGATGGKTAPGARDRCKTPTASRTDGRPLRDHGGTCRADPLPGAA